MTPNERKILTYVWDAKGQVHIKIVAQNLGFSYDYARLISSSLVRSGHMKFADANTCYLLGKGWKRFGNGVQKKIKQKPWVVSTSVVAPASDFPLAATEEEKTKESVKGHFDGELEDASEEEKIKLAEAGYKTIKDLANVSVVMLIQTLGISLRKAAKWINQAKRETGLIIEEGLTQVENEK